MEEITLNGIVYVPKSEIKEVKAKEMDGLKFCIIRTYSAGVLRDMLRAEMAKKLLFVMFVAYGIGRVLTACLNLQRTEQ